MTNLQMQNKIFYPELSYQVTGILFAVHNELGRFCNEKQYADGVEKHLQDDGLAYEREKILPISFDGETAGRNKIDFWIEDAIILELKAKRILTKEDYYQTKRYLVTLKKKLGILVNFQQKYLTPKRVLNSASEA